MDSPEVQALKAKRAQFLADGTDWGRMMARRYAGKIRAQRLTDAKAMGSHTEAEWEAILAKFDYHCVRCWCKPVGRPCKDHILPIYMGGSDTAENLQPLCRECNTGKGRDSFNWAKYREETGFPTEESPC